MIRKTLIKKKIQANVECICLPPLFKKVLILPFSLSLHTELKFPFFF